MGRASSRQGSTVGGVRAAKTVCVGDVLMLGSRDRLYRQRVSCLTRPNIMAQRSRPRTDSLPSHLRRSHVRRRSVIAAPLVLAGSRLLAACAAAAGDEPWSGPPSTQSDVRLRALSYALLAPSAHNTQPWSVALSDRAIELSIDRRRLLPQTDPHFRQTHVSQGTFLELLVIALGALGHPARVEYFPRGEYGSLIISDLPIARVTFDSGTPTRDPLFAQIPARRSNKRTYSGPAPSESQLSALQHGVADPDALCALRVVIDPALRFQLSELAARAMAAEVKLRARNVETAQWFRFNREEIEVKRDGFRLEHNGRSLITQWYAETFVLDRESAADPNGAFAKGAIDLVREQAQSAPAFGVLTTSVNTRLSQVVAGRSYARLALTAQSLGLAIHPLSQVAEEYADMTPIRSEFERAIALPAGHAVQMFFRLGHADPTPHTPRRELSTLIRKT